MCNLWKRQREWQDCCTFIFQEWALEPINNVIAYLPTAEMCLGFPLIFSYNLFQIYFCCFWVHALVSSLPRCFQVLLALKNRYQRSCKMTTGNLNNFFLLFFFFLTIGYFACLQPGVFSETHNSEEVIIGLKTLWTRKETTKIRSHWRSKSLDVAQRILQKCVHDRHWKILHVKYSSWKRWAYWNSRFLCVQELSQKNGIYLMLRSIANHLHLFQ